MAADPGPEFEFICEVCQAGHVRPRVATLVEWVDGEFITVPNFPIWLCDLCGTREYDAGALEQLRAVLGPQAALRRGRNPARAGAGRRLSNSRSTGRHSV